MNVYRAILNLGENYLSLPQDAIVLGVYGGLEKSYKLEGINDYGSGRSVSVKLIEEWITEGMLLYKSVNIVTYGPSRCFNVVNTIPYCPPNDISVIYHGSYQSGPSTYSHVFELIRKTDEENL